MAVEEAEGEPVERENDDAGQRQSPRGVEEQRDGDDSLHGVHDNQDDAAIDDVGGALNVVDEAGDDAAGAFVGIKV